MSNYAIIEKLKNSKSICLIGHATPDTDALCSMVVFKHFLTSYLNVQQVDLFADTEFIPDYYQAILEDETINGEVGEYEYAITLDTSNPVLLGKYQSILEKAKNTIVIDHHNTNLKYGNFNIVKYCSSTCEMVYRILSYYNYIPSVEDYGKIYAGIITDTNNLTVGNMSEKTFGIVGECYSKTDCQKIYKHFFSNNTLKKQLIFAKAIQNCKSYNNEEILISHISIDENFSLKGENQDYTGIINRIAQTAKAKLVCFVYPKNDTYYVSLRAIKGYDVSEIAKKHGGGGHIGAAAFEAKLPAVEIEETILKDFIEELSVKNVPNSNNPFKNN